MALRVYNDPGHAHFLTFSCFHRRQFLTNHRIRTWLVQAVDAARQEHDFALWAYVFMPEHVHLIVSPRTAPYDIRPILQRIKEPVGRRAVKYLKMEAPEWLPKITVQHGQRTAHRFWQPGGGYDRNVFKPSTLHAMIDYIHANPIRRGLVAHAEDWKWSSAGWYMDRSPNSLKPDMDIGVFALMVGDKG